MQLFEPPRTEGVVGMIIAVSCDYCPDNYIVVSRLHCGLSVVIVVTMQGGDKTQRITKTKKAKIYRLPKITGG